MLPGNLEYIRLIKKNNLVRDDLAFHLHEDIIKFVRYALPRGVKLFAGPAGDYVCNAVRNKFGIPMDMA